MKSPILGGHGQSRSLNLADNVCINLMPMLLETNDGKAPGMLLMTPGLDLVATVGNGPIRCLHVAQGVLYVVSGCQVYSVNSSLVSTLLGTLGTSSGPVSIIDNGPLGQVALFDGVSGHLISGGALSTIALPFSSPIKATYQDNFGFVVPAGTQEMYQSNAGDLSTWSAVAFSSADGSPDNIISIISIHRELWVLKQSHTEIWVDGGLNNFAFQRLDGVFLQQGCIATYSPAISGELLFWLSGSEPGRGNVVMARGYAVETISTQAMETELATYSTLADAVGYTYNQEGQDYYVLTFPTAGQTWVYGVQAGRWHKRASFSNGAFGVHLGICYQYFAGYHLVGDYQSGNLYKLNLDQPLDNGAQRKWVRSWRAFKDPIYRPIRFNSLTIDMETGAQVPDGTNPQLMLRWSDDGGHTWSSYVIQSAGQTGQTAKRVKFNRLGSTKKNSGLDRIFELSSSDPFKVAILGAEIT